MLSRRALLGATTTLLAGAAVPTWAARSIVPTAPGVEGPFYPTEWPREAADFSALDDDADLLWVRGGSGFAEGVVLDLQGRVRDGSGASLANVEVHVWQADANGRYHHPGDPNDAHIDPHFQGFGRTVTDGEGRYRFRTIRPVPYPGRTPHIHFKLKDAGDPNLLTTQMYVAGEARNADDSIYRAVPEHLRRTVTVRLRRAGRVRLAGIRRRLVRGTFDIILGVTPAAG